MKIEIGSNFWEYSLSESRKKKFWWEADTYFKTYLKSGRNAFKAICNMLEVDKKRVLFPAYHCETESNPWNKNGWDVFYYTVEENFCVSANKLKVAIEEYKPSVIVIQSFFGFESYDFQCNAVLKKYKQDGGVIIEDITQTLLSNFRHDSADYYVCSFRKFFAIPEGGVLISKKELNLNRVESADLNIVVTALEAYSLKQEYFDTRNLKTKLQFREKYVQLNELISIDDKLYAMSDTSKKILNSIDIDSIGEKRRNNFKYLQENLGKFDYLHIYYKEVDASVIPLFLPVLVKNNEIRMELREYLASKDIYCPIIWLKSDKLTTCSKETESIYSRILCFPIDQRYDTDDMDRILDSLTEWKRS